MLNSQFSLYNLFPILIVRMFKQGLFIYWPEEKSSFFAKIYCKMWLSFRLNAQIHFITEISKNDHWKKCNSVQLFFKIALLFMYRMLELKRFLGSVYYTLEKENVSQQEASWPKAGVKSLKAKSAKWLTHKQWFVPTKQEINSLKLIKFIYYLQEKLSFKHKLRQLWC